MATAKKPTKAQRAALARVLTLQKRCGALGVEWDKAILKDGECSVDEKRVTDLEMTMAETLFNKLGVRLGGSTDVATDVMIRVSSEHLVTIEELIDIGKRAGWI